MDEPRRTVTELLHEQHETIKDLFDQVRASTGQEKAETFDCLRAFLAVHETAEEEVVHPAVQTMGDEAREHVRARLEEEDHAKRVLSDLEKMGPEAEGFDAELADFEAAVLAHAEAEEDLVFPHLETGCDPTMLERMGSALLVAERLAPTHPHPHSPESALGNLLTGPLVSIVDRVRDAIRGRAAS